MSTAHSPVFPCHSLLFVQPPTQDTEKTTSPPKKKSSPKSSLSNTNFPTRNNMSIPTRIFPITSARKQRTCQPPKTLPGFLPHKSRFRPKPRSSSCFRLALVVIAQRATKLSGRRRSPDVFFWGWAVLFSVFVCSGLFVCVFVFVCFCVCVCVVFCWGEFFVIVLLLGGGEGCMWLYWCAFGTCVVAYMTLV